MAGNILCPAALCLGVPKLTTVPVIFSRAGVTVSSFGVIVFRADVCTPSVQEERYPLLLQD